MVACCTHMVDDLAQLHECVLQLEPVDFSFCGARVREGEGKEGGISTR